MMNNKAKLIITTLMLMSLVMTVVEITMNLQQLDVSNFTRGVWGLTFALLSMLWVYYDAEREEFDRPFDFGLLMYIFWPVYFPYYLIKTRGIDGVLIFLGLGFLYLGPWLFGLVAYVYYS